MTAQLVIDTSRFEQDLSAIFDGIKEPCQIAMAESFKEVVNANLGDEGMTERRKDWIDLKSRYAKRVGRSNPTLRLSFSEAAKVGGVPEQLYHSTQISSSKDAAVVFNDCEYADAHQFGGGNMPERPFFPIWGGEVLPATTAKCVESAEKTAESMIRYL